MAIMTDTSLFYIVIFFLSFIFIDLYYFDIYTAIFLKYNAFFLQKFPL